MYQHILEFWNLGHDDYSLYFFSILMYVYNFYNKMTEDKYIWCSHN